MSREGDTMTFDDDNYYEKVLAAKRGRHSVPLRKDFFTTLRYKPSTLALIAKFMMSHRVIPKTIAEVAKQAFTDYATMILDAEPDLAFKDESEAIEFLEWNRLLPSSERNKRAIHSHLSMESLRATQGDSVPSGVSQEEVNRALAMLNEPECTPMTVPLEEFNKQMGTVPDNVLVDDSDESGDEPASQE